MLYEKVKCNRLVTEKERNWLANDRWYVMDDVVKNEYRFCVAPIGLSEGQLTEEGEHILHRVLLSIKPDSQINIEKTYGTDYIEFSDMKLTMPYHCYGVVVTSKVGFSILDSSAGGLKYGDGNAPLWHVNNNICILKDGAYVLVAVTDGRFEENPGAVKVIGENTKTVIAFYNEERKAKEIAETLFINTEAELKASRQFWEKYLESCPIVPCEEEEFMTHQYWYWWNVLINVSHVEFNEFPLYMAPDREGWLGTWSNDGPETMAVLALTNQKNLVRDLILSYVGAGMDDEGNLSWYLHSDGRGCYGQIGDVGRFSHGVPAIVYATEIYIRKSGDVEILNAKCGENMTLYERLVLYFKNVWKKRDLDGDGLVEWRNLWETGWDDKLGCFFKKAGLVDWCNMVSKGSDDEIKEFYEKNCYPVIALHEQVYMRQALRAMAKMAELMQDDDMKASSIHMEQKMAAMIEQKCWNEEDGFYYDYNVREDKQIRVKGADCFYYLYFEKNPERVERICRYLDDPKAFGSMYIPMQAIDSEGFSPTGYWSGGHWPREMYYVSLGLYKAGKIEKAKEIIYKAVTSSKGHYFYEVMNPLTGEPTSCVTKMAYATVEEVALLVICEGLEWFPSELQTAI